MELICQMIPDKLGADIAVTTADISVAHRLGQKIEEASSLDFADEI